MMKLIGMLDSPFVRKVAIALDLLGVQFEHEPVSVFSHFDKFRSINPVVKAPTLVCTDGEVLMDSSLILQFVEATQTGQAKPLWSSAEKERQHQVRGVGLALIACEKCAQGLYETRLKPSRYQYEPWIERVTAQRQAAFALLEQEVKSHPGIYQNINHASLSAAITWQFAHNQLSTELPVATFPELAALSARMEKLPVFLKYPPVGPGI